VGGGKYSASVRVKGRFGTEHKHIFSPQRHSEEKKISKMS